MKLDERKLKILQAVINSYITTVEPVGSRTISKKYDLGVSSATVRNEMSDLEELGYLTQPYTSAGRIPSDKAYRLYVDCLMQEKNISGEEKTEIKKVLRKEMNQIDNIIQNVAKILSQLTSYTSLVITPQIKQSRLKHMQLVPINESKVLIVIVTESNMVKNATFRIDNELSIEQLHKVSNLLTEKLRGYKISDINMELVQNLVNEMYEFKDAVDIIMKNIVPIINQSSEKESEISLYSHGMTNIFDFPEYNDVEKAREFLKFLGDRDSVIDMLLKNESQDMVITIGDENFYKPVKDCSLITATYKLNGKMIGKIGVIGPTRMDYSKVISSVKLISTSMNEILKKYYFE